MLEHQLVMRSQLLTVVLTAMLGACAPPAGSTYQDRPDPDDAVWGDSIKAGDLVVIVPGTGAYDYLAAFIDPLPGDVPVADARADSNIYDDSQSLEGAIAAAHRAGLSDEQIQDGTITFGVWGADFALTKFVYRSLEGLEVPMQVIGGASTCSHGSVQDNLMNYTHANALIDATDLYAKIQAWLDSHPSSTDAARGVTVIAHSWGGAVAEYLALEQDAIEADAGPLRDAGQRTQIGLTVAMGVPGLILGYHFIGSGMRDFDDRYLVEINRHDDPVHTLQLAAPGGGHQYSIMHGEEFIGSYGITTDELSCARVPGPCDLTATDDTE